MSRNPFGAMAPMLNTMNYCHLFLSRTRVKQPFWSRIVYQGSWRPQECRSVCMPLADRWWSPTIILGPVLRDLENDTARCGNFLFTAYVWM